MVPRKTITFPKYKTENTTEKSRRATTFNCGTLFTFCEYVTYISWQMKTETMYGKKKKVRNEKYGS